MIRTIHRVRKMVAVTTLVLMTTGCSVFISTPRVAHIQMQRLDDKFVEYAINLEDPGETNVGFRLNNEYSLQLDFNWLWHMDKRLEPSPEASVDASSEAPLLTPWMLCEFSF